MGGKLADSDILDLVPFGAVVQTEVVWYLSNEVTSKQLQSPVVKQVLIEKRDKFDLIIFENCAGDAFSSIFHKFEAPVVAMCPYADAFWAWDTFGVPNYPSTYLQPLVSFG
jgi:hypothetical protein